MENDRTRMYVSLEERFHEHQLLQYSTKGKDIREGPSDWETINRMIHGYPSLLLDYEQCLRHS
jgi:hypothetical protein